MTFSKLLVLALSARLCLTASESCGSNCEQVSLLQSQHSAQRSQHITVKGPAKSDGTASQNLSPTCAEGFNAAFTKCLGGKNNYLMVLVSNQDDTKAYCAYTGGWAQNPENYPDHSACFVTPGQSQPLFYDSSSKSLLSWQKETVVSGPLSQDYTSLDCNGEGSSPCTSTVTNKYARKLTKAGQVWQNVPPDGEYSFNWDPSDGYIGVVTETPQKIYSMYIKNNLGPSSSNGLSADVPCLRDTSVDWQAENFPVKGLSGGCQKDNDDYWIAFGHGKVTICFPGVSC